MKKTWILIGLLLLLLPVSSAIAWCGHNDFNAPGDAEMKYTYEQSTSTHHEQILHLKFVCQICGDSYWEWWSSSPYPHEFSGNKCTLCGYTRSGSSTPTPRPTTPASCKHTNHRSVPYGTPEYVDINDPFEHRIERHYQLICTSCNKVIESDYVGKSLEKHSFSNAGSCTKCGYTQSWARVTATPKPTKRVTATPKINPGISSGISPETMYIAPGQHAFGTYPGIGVEPSGGRWPYDAIINIVRNGDGLIREGKIDPDSWSMLARGDGEWIGLGFWPADLVFKNGIYTIEYSIRDANNMVSNGIASQIIVLDNPPTVVASKTIGVFEATFLSNGECAITGYTGANSVVVPEYLNFYGTRYQVTIIDFAAFKDCWNITSVKLPESIRIIGACAFSACTALESISIPAGVTMIGDFAFEDCDNLCLRVARQSYAETYARDKYVPYIYAK